MRIAVIGTVICYSVVIGIFAYTFSFTLNEGALGGYFPFGSIAAAPIISALLGYLAGLSD